MPLSEAEMYYWFQHTAARRRLPMPLSEAEMYYWFQHTAARRRLRGSQYKTAPFTSVSTHSRPKAAANSY